MESLEETLKWFSEIVNQFAALPILIEEQFVKPLIEIDKRLGKIIEAAK